MVRPGVIRTEVGFEAIERFQANWSPVRAKKTRQIKNLEPRFDSIETGLYPPLIRHGAKLSTTANPTDGLRFDGDAKASLKEMLIPRSCRGERVAEWSWQWLLCRTFRGYAQPIRLTTCFSNPVFRMSCLQRSISAPTSRAPFSSTFQLSPQRCIPSPMSA